MKYTISSLLAIASLTSAHFNLEFPPARDFNERTLDQFPCGGFNTPSTRTPWPISGGQIALKMGHTQSNVEVLIAVGNNPGSAFNTVIRPTFLQTGLGAFCMTGLTLPSSINVTEGINATIQVITNGDPDGGLYNCADITFSSTAAAAGSCTNATGVTVGTATISGNPNGTTTSEAGSSSTTSSTKPGSASGLKAGMGGLAVAVMAAVAIVL